MVQPVHENREHMMFWLALRAVRTGRRSNHNASVVYRGLVRILKELLGDDYFRETTAEQRKDEVLLWLTSEIRRLVKNGQRQR